jgi:hypothetical protein
MACVIQMRGRHWPDSMGWQDTDFVPDDRSPVEWVAMMNDGDPQILYRIAPSQVKAGPMTGTSVVQVSDVFCIAVFAYACDGLLSIITENFEGIECYRDACSWLREHQRHFRS